MCTAAEEGGKRMVENGEKESKQEVRYLKELRPDQREEEDGREYRVY